MSNLGLDEADPGARGSMGALLSIPQDVRAALCCGRWKIWAPGMHPSFTSSTCHSQGMERSRNSPHREKVLSAHQYTPLSSTCSRFGYGKHSCSSSWTDRQKYNSQCRTQSWRWCDYGVQPTALFTMGWIQIFNWNFLNFLENFRLSSTFQWYIYDMFPDVVVWHQTGRRAKAYI